MDAREIRARFLRYFENKGHQVVESSSLVPHDDPTLLFTNAGMVQFKRVFIGEEQRPYRRAVTAQRCVRAGGKHNDLENVGHTARHHTFFEMLGNFSFGDYFKKEAIRYAWEFLTRELGLNPEQLWVSVFRDDDEAYQLWEEIEDLPPGRIVRLGEADNFWAMGDTGPCGPCSEIHIDQGEAAGCGRPDCAVGCDCDRFLELWNLVFMQFNRDADGTMTPLPRPSIDTGMGLERVAAVLQGKRNNFDCDLFTPLIERISSLSGHEYGSEEGLDVAMRVIADHARATTFLVADGVLPANEGRGYVLRRIMRRAIRFGRLLGLSAFFPGICEQVVSIMAEAYPHLEGSRELLAKVVRNEEDRFGETLDNGLAMLSEEIRRLGTEQGEDVVIGGDFIFRLYDTYGFPVDIVRDVALEKGVGFDEEGFHRAMEEQRDQSRRSWKSTDVDHLEPGVLALVERGEKSEFTGYGGRRDESVLTAIIDENGELVERAGTGQRVRLFCPRTPFYAESGGQVGDRGEIVTAGGRVRVEGTAAPVDGLTLHQGVVEKGEIEAGQAVELRVDDNIRTATALNHTATHLLHAALKRILGDHVRQAGSLVNEERLRFDFTHFSPVDAEEIRIIEEMVNDRIRLDIPLRTEVCSRDEAVAEGATALFGEKYGDQVRVVSIGDFSKELCGGTHTVSTGTIGLFKIVSESGIAAGVRRIEALTGPGAVRWLQDLAATADQVAGLLSGPFEEAPDRIKALLRQQKNLEKEVAALAASRAMSSLNELLASGVEVNGIRVISGRIQLDSAKTLREVGDRLREKMGRAVAVIGGENKGKAALLALVSRDLTDRIQAGPLVSAVAAVVGGKGGGRPDMAQAGGPMADKLDQALAEVPEAVRRLTGSEE